MSAVGYHIVFHMFIALFASIPKVWILYNHSDMKSQLSLACLYVVILFSFCCEIVKMDLNDDANDRFITENIFRENLDRSVDSGTALNTVDMLFNIGDKTFPEIELKMLEFYQQ